MMQASSRHVNSRATCLHTDISAAKSAKAPMIVLARPFRQSWGAQKSFLGGSPDRLLNGTTLVAVLQIHVPTLQDSIRNL